MVFMYEWQDYSLVTSPSLSTSLSSRLLSIDIPRGHCVFAHMRFSSQFFLLLSPCFLSFSHCLLLFSRFVFHLSVSISFIIFRPLRVNLCSQKCRKLGPCWIPWPGYFFRTFDTLLSMNLFTVDLKIFFVSDVASAKLTVVRLCCLSYIYMDNKWYCIFQFKESLREKRWNKFKIPQHYIENDWRKFLEYDFSNK